MHNYSLKSLSAEKCFTGRVCTLFKDGSAAANIQLREKFSLHDSHTILLGLSKLVISSVTVKNRAVLMIPL